MRGMKRPQFSLATLLVSIALIGFGIGIVIRWINAPYIKSPTILFAGWIASGALIGGGLLLPMSRRAAIVGAVAGAAVQWIVLGWLLSGL
jgi:hypothetical protein